MQQFCRLHGDNITFTETASIWGFFTFFLNFFYSVLIKNKIGHTIIYFTLKKEMKDYDYDDDIVFKLSIDP